MLTSLPRRASHRSQGLFLKFFLAAFGEPLELASEWAFGEGEGEAILEVFEYLHSKFFEVATVRPTAA